MAMRRELGWVALVPALTVPTIGALLYFAWFNGEGIGKAAYAATKVFTVVYPLFFLGWIGLGGLTRREEGSADRPSWRVVIGSGLGSGAAIAGIGMLLMLTPLGDAVRSGAAAVSAKVDGLGVRENFILFAVFLSVVHSGIEEYYWRWFLYGHLRRLCPRVLGHAVAALGFAAHHLVVTMQYFPFPLALFLTACVAVGGLIWTLMYEWQGTVVGCWLSHLVVDAFLMGVGYQLIIKGN